MSLLDHLPGRVLDDWLAYWSVEPWGEQRADLRTALQSANFHASMTGEKLSIDNFLPDFESTPQTREQQELEHALKMWESLADSEE